MRRESRDRRKNEGFSLIELIVVISITAILAGAGAYAFVNMSSWRVDQCVKELDTVMSETSINAMSRESCYLSLYQKDDGHYYAQVSGKEEKKIGDKSLSVTYKVYGGAADIPVTKANPLRLTYNRSSGAFKPIITAVDNSGTLTFGSDYCASISISMGGKHNQTIKLSKDTGKHYVED